MKRWLWRGVLGLLGLWVLLGFVNLGRLAVAGPPTGSNDGDVKKAARTAASRSGGEDQRGPLAGGRGWVGGNGVVEPKDRETRVAAQVSAVVDWVAVKEGQRVKAGDLLVQLASAAEAAAYEAAKAEWDAERATLAKAQKGLRLEDKEAVVSEALAAEERALQSANFFARIEALQKSEAVTQDEVEKARRTAASDAATFKALEARKRAAEAGSRSEDIGVARARSAAAEARMKQAMSNWERLKVRAPLDGEVLQVKVRAGELYSFQGSEPLVILGDTSKLRVRIDVDERDVAKVRLGARAYAVADAFGDKRFGGTVVEMARRFGRKNVRTDDPVERNDTKVLEVVMELDEPGELLTGQRVMSFIEVPGA